MPRFSPGETVVFRNVWHGRVFSAFAVITVEDGDDVLVAWLPPGSAGKRPRRRHQPWDRDWVCADSPWHGQGVLVAKEKRAGHSIWHFRRDDGSFWLWYGNLDEPLRETHFGYDWRDNVLDVVREADGDWRWKDEDEFADAIAHGLFTAEEAARIRADGERVMREVAIPTGWEGWTPPPEWRPRTLPADWHVV